MSRATMEKATAVVGSTINSTASVIRYTPYRTSRIVKVLPVYGTRHSPTSGTAVVESQTRNFTGQTNVGKHEEHCRLTPGAFFAMWLMKSLLVQTAEIRCPMTDSHRRPFLYKRNALLLS